MYKAMKLKTEIHKGVFVVICDGTRLDASFAQKFFSSMQSFIQKGHRDIVLELSRVQFVDSTGLGAIVRSLKEIDNKGHLVLSGVNETVLSLLEMTHLDAVFLRATTLVTALELLQAEQEKALVKTESEAVVISKETKGFDSSMLSSLTMDDDEQIQELDTSERRRHRRVGYKRITSKDIIFYITNKGTSKRTAAIILNISASGVLAVSPSKLSVGDTFMMEGRIGTTFKLKENVIIRNCREGKYGFEFIKPSQNTTTFLHQMTGAVVLDGNSTR